MRLKQCRELVHQELSHLPVEKIISATNHLYGVSLATTLLAKKRNLNVELASMSAMLHDIYAYKMGSYTDHAHQGAIMAREILLKMGSVNEEEIDIICSAIYHHDDKLVVDSPMDECLKDADVIHHCFNDVSKPVKDKEKARFEKLVIELGLEE